MGRSTVSAGGIVINSRQQVVLVNQRGNSWSLPKGHLDPGEALIDAARREIYEEAGISDLTLETYVGSYSRLRIGKNGGEDNSESKELHFFIFSTGQVDLVPVDSKNHPEARWVSLTEAVEMLTHPQDREFLQNQIPVILKRSQ